jgi:hypothetical protein
VKYKVYVAQKPISMWLYIDRPIKQFFLTIHLKIKKGAQHIRRYAP